MAVWKGENLGRWGWEWEELPFVRLCPTSRALSHSVQKAILLLSLCKEESGTQRLYNLLKMAQQASGRAKIQISVCLTPKPAA